MCWIFFAGVLVVKATRPQFHHCKFILLKMKYIYFCIICGMVSKQTDKYRREVEDCRENLSSILKANLRITKNYDIKAGRPNLTKWIEAMDSVEPEENEDACDNLKSSPPEEVEEKPEHVDRTLKQQNEEAL